jgi:hypothetical protein
VSFNPQFVPCLAPFTASIRRRFLFGYSVTAMNKKIEELSVLVIFAAILFCATCAISS